jgi:hypothetical protein
MACNVGFLPGFKSVWVNIDVPRTRLVEQLIRTTPYSPVFILYGVPPYDEDKLRSVADDWLPALTRQVQTRFSPRWKAALGSRRRSHGDSPLRYGGFSVPNPDGNKKNKDPAIKCS